MALEPVTVSLDDKNPELDDMTMWFWIVAALTVPLLAFMIWPVNKWFEWAFATPVGGARLAAVFERAFDSIRNRSFLNMFTLIGLGVSVSYIYSWGGESYFEPACVDYHLGSFRASAGTARPRADAECVAGIAGARTEDGSAGGSEWF